jgi:hypothetical protein
MIIVKYFNGCPNKRALFILEKITFKYIITKTFLIYLIVTINLIYKIFS